MFAIEDMGNNVYDIRNNHIMIKNLDKYENKDLTDSKIVSYDELIKEYKLFVKDGLAARTLRNYSSTFNIDKYVVYKEKDKEYNKGTEFVCCYMEDENRNNAYKLIVNFLFDSGIYDNGLIYYVQLDPALGIHVYDNSEELTFMYTHDDKAIENVNENNLVDPFK